MPLLAYVLVKMKPGTSKEIVNSRAITGVQMAHSVMGRYDAVLVIKADDYQSLAKTIYNVIERHPNVVSTETLLSLFYLPKEGVERPLSVTSFHCPSCHNLVEVDEIFCHFCGLIFSETKR